MKKLLLICFLFSINVIYSQTITEERKQYLISQITNTTDQNIVFEIEKYKVQEAIPKLEAFFWLQEPTIRYNFLTTLKEIGSTNVTSFANPFLDSLLTGFCPECRRSEVFYTFEILFELNDFTRINTFFNLLDSTEDYRDAYAGLMVLAGTSTYKERAREYLLQAMFSSNDNNNSRGYAFSSYEKAFGADEIMKIHERIIKNIKSNILSYFVFYYVLKYDAPDMLSLLKERLAVDTSVTCRYIISRAIILKYHNPVNIDFLKQTTNNDPLLKKEFESWFQEQEPIVINKDINAIQLTDSLIIYHTQCKSLNWLGDAIFSSQLQTLLNEARTKLNSGDSLGAAISVKQYQAIINTAYADSLNNNTKFVTADGYKFLYYYPQYILERLPSLPTVKLINSTGTALPGGNLQYYEGFWKDAFDDGWGYFSLGTKLKTVSLKMTYAYASQIKSNIAIGKDTVFFQTVNTAVQLKNSSGNLIDAGTVQYYSGAWRNFGTTTNGVATKELLPINYSFRMGYEFASVDKQQNLSVDPTVVFQTVNAAVQLKNSLGNLIDAGTVQYYSGAWRNFGTTTNGVANKELLPINYSFRMAYEFASIDKQQNISVDPTVVFQTVNAAVQLKNSLGSLIDAGTVQYYSGAWRNFGTTTNGIATKELLPINYSFRMAYEFASIDKQQNISVDPTVVFQAVNAAVQLKNSSGNLIDAGTVQYYSGAWRNFGTTTNGVARKELLPINYSFRMAYEFASIDKQQNLLNNPTVVFQTVNAAVQLKNSSGNLIDAGTVQYYSGAWRNFGTTTNGLANKELLPINYSFRMAYEFASIDKQQNLSVDPTVVFQTVNAAVQLKNSLGNLIDAGTVQFYSGAWRNFGTTTNGVATKELLPINYSFRMVYEYVSNDKQQNLSTNPVVYFTTVLCSVKVSNTTNQPLSNANVKYYSGAWRDFGITNADGVTTKELLPANLSFRASVGNVSMDKQQDITANNLVEINLNTP